MKDIAIIGAGGHSKVIIDLINLLEEYNIIGIYDDEKTDNFCNLKILGKINDIDTSIENFVIAIGNNKIRNNIFLKFPNLFYPILKHPSSILSKNIKIGEGTIIMAGVIIQTDVIIGKQCIFNTGCSIDHECIIKDFSSICPKTVLCGNVFVGSLTMVGSGSVIIQNKKVGNNCIIGAGSVIFKDVFYNQKIIGFHKII